jgi:hypothetical protein
MRVQWTITLTTNAATPDQAVADLRRLLKLAGRRFGMHCAVISEERLAVRPIRRRRTPSQAMLFDAGAS